MVKKILFPFSIHTSYYEGYSWAIELALKMEAELWLFTTSESRDDESKQLIFQSLLEAQGHYLKSATGKNSEVKIKTERWIETGNLTDSLLSFLKKNPIDITILDSSLPMDSQSEFPEVINSSKGAIVLHSKNEKAQENIFYERLRHAELYKLPENFFDTLSNDHSLFNYLRKVFKRNNE
jgi:hypothetical protein